MSEDKIIHDRHEIKNTFVAVGSGLAPKTLYISCEEVTVSVNALRLKLDFNVEQLKQFDTIEINGLIFQRIGEKLCK